MFRGRFWPGQAEVALACRACEADRRRLRNFHARGDARRVAHQLEQDGASAQHARLGKVTSVDVNRCTRVELWTHSRHPARAVAELRKDPDQLTGGSKKSCDSIHCFRQVSQPLHAGHTVPSQPVPPAPRRPVYEPISLRRTCCQADRGTVRPNLAPDLDGGLFVPVDIEPGYSSGVLTSASSCSSAAAASSAAALASRPAGLATEAPGLVTVA